MKKIDSTETLQILNSLSDQLWVDYKKGRIDDREYATKIEHIRKEIKNVVSVSFLDLQNIASQAGYIILKKPGRLDFSITSIHN